MKKNYCAITFFVINVLLLCAKAELIKKTETNQQDVSKTNWSESEKNNKAISVKPVLMTWIQNIDPVTWQYDLDSFGSYYPVEMIFKHLNKIGVTHLFLCPGRYGNGYVPYPTKIKYGLPMPEVVKDKRDFLKETLDEAEKYGIQVFLVITPDKRPPSEDVKKARAPLYSRNDKGIIIEGAGLGLNHPEVYSYYHDMIDELINNYGHYKSFAGLSWHEYNSAMYTDTFGDDLDQFKAFCESRYGENYTGNEIPTREDANDKWWRRSVLFRNNVLNTFFKDMSEHVKKRGNLKTWVMVNNNLDFNYSGWKWGNDIVFIENCADNIWVSRGGSKASAEHLINLRGAAVDYGISYPKQNVPLLSMLSFHGKPLIFFEAIITSYFDSQRIRYRSSRSEREPGDFYRTYMGVTEEEEFYFLGRDNIKRWTGLMVACQNSRHLAEIAVVVNSVPFQLRNPKSADKYKEETLCLIDTLSYYCDVEALELNSSMGTLAELLKYKLIIFTEDMPIGLSEEKLNTLMEYVKQGGKIFSINALWHTGRDDLTEEKDVTAYITGVKPITRDAACYRPSVQSAITNIADVSSEGHEIQGWELEPENAEILAINNDKKPILLRYPLGKGEVISSWINIPSLIYLGEKGFVRYLTQIINMMATPPIRGDGSFRILDCLKKDNVVLISLIGPGKGKLRIDLQRIPINETAFQVKELIAGDLINSSNKNGWNADELSRNGVDLDLADNEPCLIAVGNGKRLSSFPGGIVPKWVLKKLAVKQGEVELNAQVPDELKKMSNDKRIKVGILKNTLAAGEILDSLKQNDQISPYFLPYLNNDILKLCDVLILPQAKDPAKDFNPYEEIVRKWVEGGGGVILLHNAAGFATHNKFFPEICEKCLDNPLAKEISIEGKHPITNGLNMGFKHSYGDHITLKKGPQGDIVLKDNFKDAVLLAGKLGKGKVVVNGMCPGIQSPDNSYDAKPCKITGPELTVLCNSIFWLTNKTEMRSGQ